MTQLEVRPLSRAVGAEILGLNLLNPVSDAQIAEIRKIWLQHSVVFFREQPLEPGAFQAFAQRFGEIIEYPFVKGLPDFPLIVPVLKLPHEKHNFGGVWHTDTTYLQEPPMATMLIARELPPVGGDTLFASNYAAFEGLSPALQDTLRTLKGVNSSAKAAVTHSREDRLADSATDKGRSELNSEHPVVRTHPVSGRRGIYVNENFTTRIIELAPDKGAEVLSFLTSHVARPEFRVRWEWKQYDLAFWDNRLTQHFAFADYLPHRRVMHRATILGDKPFR